MLVTRPWPAVAQAPSDCAEPPSFPSGTMGWARWEIHDRAARARCHRVHRGVAGRARRLVGAFARRAHCFPGGAATAGAVAETDLGRAWRGARRIVRRAN